MSQIEPVNPQIFDAYLVFGDRPKYIDECFILVIGFDGSIMTFCKLSEKQAFGTRWVNARRKDNIY